MEGMRDRDMALEGGAGGRESVCECVWVWVWGVLQVTTQKGPRLSGALTSELHGDQLSAFNPLTLS